MNVRARFAFYHPGFDDIRPEPSYYILESDNPNLPVHGNVGGDQLLKEGVAIPLTPDYKTWLKKQGGIKV